MRIAFTALIGLAACAAPAAPLRDHPRLFNYDESKVPPYALPDLLRFRDGRAVDGPDAWRARRVELIGLFEEHVYGRAPGAAPATDVAPVAANPDALEGRASWRQVSLRFAGTAEGPRMDLLLVLPKAARQGVPVLLGLNFQGNHAVLADPAVPLSRSWMRAKGRGVVDHRATEASRGAAAASWPLEAAVRRGYAVATAYYGDLAPDHNDSFEGGVHPLFYRPGQTAPAPDEWGKLAAWAWGLRRAVDYLVTAPEIDARRIAVLGHSRLGKAALWAGAQDERIALAISNNSGLGGAALYRRDYGETVAWANRFEPLRFNGNFRGYGPRPDALPVDAHHLIALMAPRPVYVASATEDRWADPLGEFLGARGADPAYALHGLKGLGLDAPPLPDTPVGERIGYHLRTGPHALTAYDWERYMDFADRHLGRP